MYTAEEVSNKILAASGEDDPPGAEWACESTARPSSCLNWGKVLRPVAWNSEFDVGWGLDQTSACCGCVHGDSLTATSNRSYHFKFL